MKLLIGIFALMAFSSCEKEIELDLETNGDQLVIEGTISNTTDIQTIQITKSVDFYEPNAYPSVTGASVTVSENNGPSVIFTETSPGIYQASNFTGVPGNTYALQISYDGAFYTATSKMPLVVPLTELTFEENAFTQPGEDQSYVVIPKFIDPVNTKNYYRYNLFINGVKDNTFFTQNDDLFDGLENSLGIRSNDNDNAIIFNDTATVEMFCIDENVYNYFYVLEQNSDSQNTPNNPISNINGGALGYFSAQNKQQLTITIQ